METLNAYQIKWAVFTTVSDKGFSHRYKSMFRNLGIHSIGSSNDLYAFHYNSLSEISVNRKNEIIKKLSNKVNSYKKAQGILSFTITDKQFGLIGAEVKWSSLTVPTSLGKILVTNEQLYNSGCIALRGSQARYNHPNKIN